MKHISRHISRCSLDLSALEESQKENLDGKEKNCVFTREKRTTPPSISTKEIENVLNLFLSEGDLEDLFAQLSVDSLYSSGIIDWIEFLLGYGQLVARTRSCSENN
ncbi:hypothetical protein Gasu2_57470 [Galdieria sulphuraria]|nr:hypothetical protein Gasu2_57470 [Galdieria sulphuraria]